MRLRINLSLIKLIVKGVDDNNLQGFMFPKIPEGKIKRRKL